MVWQRRRLASIEPAMSFFRSSSPDGTILQQTACHAVTPTNDILSYLFARCHRCDRMNAVRLSDPHESSAAQPAKFPGICLGIFAGNPVLGNLLNIELDSWQLNFLGHVMRRHGLKNLAVTWKSCWQVESRPVSHSRFSQTPADSVLMSNTHRRRDATKQFRRVGIGGVYWA